MPNSSSRTSDAQRTVRRQPAPDGIVIVDKPQGWTSHDVVGKMRSLAATRKVGHAGTLDPMATGVLVVGIGKATRLLNYIVGADKEYLATIRLGFETTTEDADGEAIHETAGLVGKLELDHIQSAADQLTGDIMQVPSSVSAIKIDGKRSYDRVRAGETVEIPARPAHVGVFEVLGMAHAESVLGPVIDVDVRVSVSSGTYVRALGRDLARALGTQGHLTALRRTRVGGYRIDKAATLEQLAHQVSDDDAITVVPLAQAAAATFAVRNLSEEEAIALGFGKRLHPVAAVNDETVMAGIGPDGTLVALLKDDGHKAQPAVVFAPRQ